MEVSAQTDTQQSVVGKLYEATTRRWEALKSNVAFRVALSLATLGVATSGVEVVEVFTANPAAAAEASFQAGCLNGEVGVQVSAPEDPNGTTTVKYYNGTTTSTGRAAPNYRGDTFLYTHQKSVSGYPVGVEYADGYVNTHSTVTKDCTTSQTTAPPPPPPTTSPTTANTAPPPTHPNTTAPHPDTVPRSTTSSTTRRATPSSAVTPATAAPPATANTAPPAPPSSEAPASSTTSTTSEAVAPAVGNTNPPQNGNEPALSPASNSEHHSGDAWKIEVGGAAAVAAGAGIFFLLLGRRRRHEEENTKTSATPPIVPGTV